MVWYDECCNDGPLFVRSGHGNQDRICPLLDTRSGPRGADESPVGSGVAEDRIYTDHGDVRRLAASVRDGSLKPYSILRKLGAYRQQNWLYLALGEAGLIERSLFMLDWIESRDLRMGCQAGLNI